EFDDGEVAYRVESAIESAALGGGEQLLDLVPGQVGGKIPVALRRPNGAGGIGVDQVLQMQKSEECTNRREFACDGSFREAATADAVTHERPDREPVDSSPAPRRIAEVATQEEFQLIQIPCIRSDRAR